MRESLCFTVTLALAATVLCGGQISGVQPAHARWKSEYANSPLRAWYEQQHDKQGWSCCDHSDAHAVYDTVFKGGRWHVLIGGIDHEVLPRQLLDGPNPTGHAVAWYDGVGDHVTIFCFSPGTLS